jgi:hypothetical protein
MLSENKIGLSEKKHSTAKIIPRLSHLLALNEYFISLLILFFSLKQVYFFAEHLFFSLSYLFFSLSGHIGPYRCGRFISALDCNPNTSKTPSLLLLLASQ